MDPNVLYVWLGSIAFVAGGVKWVIGRLDARFDQIETKQAAMQRQLDTQFGGNGNGLRQKIDEHGKDIAFIKGSLGITQD